MQDNGALYLLVGALIVAVGVMAFYNRDSFTGMASTTPTVIERNNTTVVERPPAEHTTIINPPAEQPKTPDLNIDIHNDRR